MAYIVQVLTDLLGRLGRFIAPSSATATPTTTGPSARALVGPVLEVHTRNKLLVEGRYVPGRTPVGPVPRGRLVEYIRARYGYQAYRSSIYEMYEMARREVFAACVICWNRNIPSAIARQHVSKFIIN